MNLLLIIDFFKGFTNDLINGHWGYFLLIVIIFFILIKIEIGKYHYPQIIYAKQFDGYCELLGWINRVILYLNLYSENFECFSKEVQVSKEKIEKETRKLLDNIFGENTSFAEIITQERTHLFNKWSNILPVEIENAFLDFCNSLPTKPPETVMDGETTRKILEKHGKKMFEAAMKYFCSPPTFFTRIGKILTKDVMNLIKKEK